MAISAPADGSSNSLAGVLHQAGAVFAPIDGHATPIHYGSAAGELAVCVRAVGLVDRTGLSKLVIAAPPPQLAHLTARLTAATVAPGGALFAGGAWWCGAAADQLIVLCEPHLGKRLQPRLRAQAMHHVAVKDRSDDWAAIGLLGGRAEKLLRALGAYGESGDPRSTLPFSDRSIAGIAALVLLESDRRALVLVARERAGEAWRAIEAAGRPFGISCVGLEAARRYELLERGQSASRIA